MQLNHLYEDRRWDYDPRSSSSQALFKARNRTLEDLRQRAGEALSPVKDSFHRILAEPSEEDMQFVQEIDDELKEIGAMNPRYDEYDSYVIAIGRKIEQYLAGRWDKAVQSFKMAQRR